MFTPQENTGLHQRLHWPILSTRNKLEHLLNLSYLNLYSYQRQDTTVILGDKIATHLTCSPFIAFTLH